jgi:hypothetical protein
MREIVVAPSVFFRPRIDRLEVTTTPGPQATVEIHQWTTSGDAKVFIYQ